MVSFVSISQEPNTLDCSLQRSNEEVYDEGILLLAIWQQCKALGCNRQNACFAAIVSRSSFSIYQVAMAYFTVIAHSPSITQQGHEHTAVSPDTQSSVISMVRGAHAMHHYSCQCLQVSFEARAIVYGIATHARQIVCKRTQQVCNMKLARGTLLYVLLEPLGPGKRNRGISVGRSAAASDMLFSTFYSCAEDIFWLFWNLAWVMK